jgi:hypothetical protein
MSYWGQNMSLFTEEKLIETEDTEVQCGHISRSLILAVVIVHYQNPAHKIVKMSTGYEKHVTKTKNHTQFTQTT